MKTADILKHYGVKGMKWEHRNVDPEIQKLIDARDQNFKDIQDAHSNIEERLNKTAYDLKNLVGGKRSVTQELGDVVKVAFGGKGSLNKESRDLKYAVTDKLNSVSKNVKKTGYNALLKIFGPAKKKSTITTYVESPNKRR